MRILAWINGLILKMGKIIHLVYILKMISRGLLNGLNMDGVEDY